MAHHTQAPLSLEQEREALETWTKFTALLKYATIAAISVVALLGLIFISW